MPEDPTWMDARVRELVREATREACRSALEEHREIIEWTTAEMQRRRRWEARWEKVLSSVLVQGVIVVGGFILWVTGVGVIEWFKQKLGRGP